MSFSIGKSFKCETHFEISISAGGWHFLVIFGEHANGHFIALPGYHIACEAAEATDIFYNRALLQTAISALADSEWKTALSKNADDIVLAIKHFALEGIQ